MKTKITVLIIVLAIIGIGVLFINKSKQLPTDLSSWYTIDTLSDGNFGAFTLVEIPNPRFEITVPPEYKRKVTATKRDASCDEINDNETDTCVEESFVAYDIRHILPSMAIKYSPGYNIKMTKTDKTLEEIVTPIYAKNAKKDRIADFSTNEIISGQNAYLIVWDRNEAVAQKQYVYYIIKNGTLITISSYNRPSPDFLATLLFK